MSKNVEQRIRELLNELRSAGDVQAPRVRRDGYHVLVGDSEDPLREDFVSSGMKRDQEETEIALAD